MQVATLKIANETKGQDPVEIKTMVPLNNIPGVPMRRVHKRMELENLDCALPEGEEWEKRSKNSSYKKAYHRGDWAPDVISFYLQWAECNEKIRAALCHRSDSFELPKDLKLADAIKGWAKKSKKRTLGKSAKCTVGACHQHYIVDL